MKTKDLTLYRVLSDSKERILRIHAEQVMIDDSIKYKLAEFKKILENLSNNGLISYEIWNEPWTLDKCIRIIKK